VVVGQRRELAADVGDVGGEAGGGTAAPRVEQRRVADHRSRDARDPAGAQLMNELLGRRAVAAFPHGVEGAVAERRVTGTAQVQVPVPDTPGAEVPGAEHRGM
jgi:hypothetical protein